VAIWGGVRPPDEGVDEQDVGRVLQGEAPGDLEDVELGRQLLRHRRTFGVSTVVPAAWPSASREKS
jgi:hypothetical protein